MPDVTSSHDQIAIIVVTHESGKHIGACLRSLPNAAPEYRLHLIVSDNASRDDTREQVRTSLQKMSNARISSLDINYAENLGFTRAVNQALAHVPEGAPVLFLNPDTESPPGSLAALVNKLYKGENIGVVAPQLRYPSNDGGTLQPSCRRFPTYTDLFFELTGLSRLFPRSAAFNHWKMGDFDHRTRCEVDQPQGAYLLARHEVIKQVGKWDERFPLFFSDVDWCRRVRQAGWEIFFEPDVFVFHEKGASVKQARPAAIWSSHVSFWRYFRKWRASGRDEILSIAIAPVLVLAAFVRIAWHYVKRCARHGSL